MIELSRHEAACVFTHFIPGFRPDRLGRWRGPAVHRAGNNPTALAVDVERGVWYDHVAGEGGDAVDFVRAALGVDFVGACRAISDVIGRAVLDRRPIARQPQYSDAEIAEAELFRVGLAWHIERELGRRKEEMWRSLQVSDKAVEHSEPVRRLTAFLAELQSCVPYEVARYARELRRTRPQLVADRIAEARDAQIQLARAIVGVSLAEAA